MCPAPLIWFQLLDSADSQPYKGTAVSSILRSTLSVPVVQQLLEVVKAKYDEPDYLKNVSIENLQVFVNKSFKKRKADGEKEEPLQFSHSLEGLGETENEALYIIVPSIFVSIKESITESEIKIKARPEF